MTASHDRLEGQTLAAGRAGAAIAFLDQPLSFWGGFDSAKGIIVEPAHPQAGLSLAGRILVMEKAKGSSSSSSVLAEAIRNGTGPAGIVMKERDLIVALGCIVADELYGKAVPLAVLDALAWERLRGMPRDALAHVDCSPAGLAVVTLACP
ncbi:MULTISPECIES: aconitase X swivel domain-containing protein [Cupriavidus]